jgi:ATP-dependent DNA helicase RecG
VKGSEKSSEKSSEKIIELMKANSLITIAELAENLAVSTRAIEKHIAKLKEDKRIERVGADKGGYWEVLDTTEE